MRDGGELHSLQFIAEDGDKRFLTGGRVAGCYFSIGTTQGAAALCIAEGFATGATIFEATGYPVAVAFNAGNLGLVAKAIRERFPDLSLILCADDDAATTGNPGMTKATEAAQAVGGLLAAPNFGENRPEGATDFNDMAAHRGLEAVRLAIASASAPRGYGYTGIQSTDIPSTSIQALIGRLAKLQPMEYDRAREREAKQLGVRVATLDTEVRKARGETAEDAAQGHAMVFPETEPWPEAVDGGELLDEVAGRLAGYLV